MRAIYNLKCENLQFNGACLMGPGTNYKENEDRLQFNGACNLMGPGTNLICPQFNLKNGHFPLYQYEKYRKKHGTFFTEISSIMVN